MPGLFDDIMREQAASEPTAAPPNAGGGLFDDIMAVQPQPSQPAPRVIEDFTDPTSRLYSQRHGGSFVTGLFDGIKKLVTDPARAATGELQVWDPVTGHVSDEAVESGFNAAAFANPVAPRGLVPTVKAPPVAAHPKGGGEVAEAAARLSQEGSPVNVPRGVASDRAAVQALYQRGRQVPGATEVITKSLDDFYKGVETKVDEVAARAAGGEVKDPATLGASVRTSVEKAIEGAEAKGDEAFAIMRRAIDPEMPVHALTDDVAKTLNYVMAERSAAGERGIADQLTPTFNILTDPKGVSFNGLQRARSQVGRAIQWDEARGGMVAGDLKRVYGALTQAMETAARASAKNDPDAAVSLLKAADARFAKMSADNKVLRSVLRPDADEGLVNSLISMASSKSGNIRKLSQTLHEMGPDAINDLTAFVVQGLGRNRKGEFSPNAFETNWASLSPAGKSLLFRDKAVRQALEDLATVAKRMAETQRKFANSSNTAGNLGAGATAAGLFVDPVTTIATLIGANGMARILSKPATARAAARYAKTLEALSKSRSPEVAARLEKAQLQFLATVERAGIVAVNDNSAIQAASGQ